MNLSNLLLEIFFTYGVAAGTSATYIYKNSNEARKYKSGNPIFFDEFSTAYKIASILFFLLIPIIFICAELSQKLEAEGLMKDGFFLLIGAALNSLFLMHSFNKKIFIFDGCFFISNFLGNFKRINFSELKNSKEFYTKNFGEGYIIKNNNIKIKIPAHFINVNTLLKIIKEQTEIN